MSESRISLYKIIGLALPTCDIKVASNKIS